MLSVESLVDGKFNFNLVYYYILYQICQAAFSYILQLLEYIQIWVEPLVLQKFYLDSTGDSQIYDILEYIYKNNMKRVNKDYTERYGGDSKFNDLIAPGTYIVMFKGKPIITNYRQELDKYSNMISYLTMWTISLNKNFFTEFMKEIEKTVMKQQKCLYIKSCGDHIYTHNSKVFGIWHKVGPVPKRSLHDTILDDDTLNNLTSTLDTFYKKPEYYKRYNIPYKLCILISSEPGMGKTSIIKSLADKYGTNLYSISLNSLNDNTLPYVFHSVRNKSFLAFEDVDCMAINRENNNKHNNNDDDDDDNNDNNKRKGVTLSGFLNALDGIVVTEGLVIIMTTNYPERLDAALIRQERVHLHCRLEKSVEVYSKMFKRFFPEVPKDKLNKFANSCLEKKMNLADLQAHCLKNIDNMNQAFILL